MTNDQFKPWLREHLARHPRHDWPAGEEAIALFGGWLAAFKLRGVTYAEADDASRWLMERGSTYTDNHLGLMLGRVEQRRKDRQAEESARLMAERRAGLDAERARDAELAGLWDDLSEWDRQRLEAEVEAENPGLARFPYFVRRLAQERAALGRGRGEEAWR